VEALFACEPQPGEVARVRQMVTDAYGPVFKLAVRVEPALLAGVRLRIDDRQVDASLAGRITRLKNGLLKPMRLDAAASEESRISL
jgi:F0F1-type ATP synthase delta subunit